MDNNISENDKKLWNRVKNSTTRLNKEKYHNIKQVKIWNAKKIRVNISVCKTSTYY